MQRIKALIIFLLIHSFVVSTYSQSNLYIGTKLGVNMGSPIPLEDIPDGAKGSIVPGYNLGFVFNYPVNRHFSFQIELGYCRKAAKFSTPIDSMPYTDKIHHPLYPEIVFEIETFFNGETHGMFDNYYFEMPLMMNYHFNNKWSISAGGYYSWLNASRTNATATGTAGFDPKIRNEILDFAQNTRKNDFGYLLGTQFKLKESIGLNMRFMYGAKSIFIDSYDKVEYSLNNLFAEFSVIYSIYPHLFREHNRKG